MSNHIMLEGPAGLLESEYDEGSRATAVLCHPHPVYGGTMFDAVLGELCNALQKQDVGTFRFNFRGVGASEGRHDEGIGEVDDVISACRWAEDNRGPDRVMLGGYSFGAAAAIKAAPMTLACGLLLAAPPPALIGDAPAPELPTVIVVGDRDSFVDIDRLRRWINDAPVDLLVVPGADHFFMGHAASLQEAASLSVARLPDQIQ